jgi:hypothetical protein
MAAGAALLSELNRAGFILAAEGERLFVTPAARLTAADREAIRAHKRELLAALLLEGLRDEYEERAGIVEYDGGQPRTAAERLAFEAALAEWLNDDASLPPLPPAGVCPSCTRPLAGDAVPLLRPGAGHLWLHAGCTAMWLRQRKGAGAAALAGAGIATPPGWTP